MNKSLLWAVASTALFSSSTFAYIPASSITKMSLQVYGIYTSSDATCKTGLTATIPLSKTPQTINFADKPTIGSGSIPSTINCVVIVIADSLTNAWSTGTYTSTSNGHSDASCNTGGSTTGQTICNSGTPTWPDQITTDAAAIGLTLKTTSCSTATTSDIVPLILSTNSICTGQSTVDSAVTACNGGNINNFAMPTSTADATNGTKLTSISTTGDLKFVVNPENTLGDRGSGCDNQSAPLFSFTTN